MSGESDKLKVQRVACRKTGAIKPGEVMVLKVPVPSTGILIGGGGYQAHGGPLPQAQNYVMQASRPVWLDDGKTPDHWLVSWTNVSTDFNPGHVEFVAYAIFLEGPMVELGEMNPNWTCLD